MTIDAKAVDAKTPFLLSLRSSPGFITWSVAIAVFTDIILYGTIIPIFPVTAEERAHVPKDQVQKWLSIALGMYGAGLFVGAPIFGYVADNVRNRRLPLLAGGVVLLLATLMLWLSTSANFLIIGRFFQGVACSCVWSVGLAMIVDTVKKEDVGQSLGFVMVWLSVGFVVGPTIGGVIFDRLGYDAVFIVSIVMIIIDIGFRLLLIEKEEAMKYTTDTEHQPLLIVKPTPKSVKPSKIPPFLLLLASTRMCQALLSCACVALVLTSFEATLAIQLFKHFHYTSTQAGFMFVTLVLPSIAGPWIGHICDKYGARWLVTLGFLITLPCLFVLREPHDATTFSQARICIALLGIGLGQAFVMTPVVVEIEAAVVEEEERKPERYGEQGAMAQGYALFIFAYSAGTLVGPIYAAEMVRTFSWSTLTFSLGVISIVVTIFAAFFTGARPILKDTTEDSHVDDVV